MSKLDAIQEAVRDLRGDDLAAFRKWFYLYCNTGAAMDRFKSAVRTAADYEDFDPEEFDDLNELLADWSYHVSLDDLRNLESEADAARADAAKDEGPGEYTVYRALFAEANPEPPYDAPPAERAAWEWEHLAFYYERTGRAEALSRHRLEKGSFIERKTRMHEDAQASADEFLAPLREEARRRREAGEEEEEPEPWPPDHGDAVGPYLALFQDAAEPEELAEERANRENPAYAAGDDLHAAAYGWWRSLYREDYDLASPLHLAITGLASAVELASSGGIYPGNIGGRLHALKKAMAQAQDVLGLLDAMQGHAWLTHPAYTTLKALVEATRDAALDHYVEVRAIYDGLREVALRKLGGTKDD